MKDDKDIRKLDPGKYLVKKMYRRYILGKHDKPIKKVDVITKETEKKPSNHIFIGIICVLAILIIATSVFVFMPRKLSADFIDKNTGDYMQGYVYFDDIFVGETDGKDFKGFTKEYCSGDHIVTIESGVNAFEWQTYPIDCKAKKVVFDVVYEDAIPSKNIVFRFLDTTESYQINGKLSFDGVLFEEIDGLISIPREKCRSISEISFEHKEYYGKWINGGESCSKNREIKFIIDLIEIEEEVVVEEPILPEENTLPDYSILPEEEDILPEEDVIPGEYDRIDEDISGYIP